MLEVATGVWHWRAPHPDRTPDERWAREVSSYAVDDGTRLLLFDPLSVPGAVLALAVHRDPVVVLTAPWHERDTRNLVESLGAPVFVPPPDTADDLVQKFGIAAEQAAGGSPDVGRLLAGDAGEGHLYAAGDRLPVGIEARAGREHNDLVLWYDRAGALIAGDTLGDFGRGPRINERLRGGVTHEEVVERPRPLLALPIEIVLPAHGEPADRAALERALSLRPRP
ncbi:MBL fold metallo-hydrolase [Streptomyces sp. NPDC026673]|uniref:MBL fold metallo-hydrolase n=1 Tax=Streptomyces sp. NPDC026673 TaxID=3155724 RepID=UPI0033C8D693